MGVELELGVLLAFAIVAQSSFTRFEIETPAWRKIVKWSVMTVVTVSLSRWVGHWALLLPLGLGLVGTIFHVIWCRRNGINALKATPTRKYYELRGWRWPADRT